MGYRQGQPQRGILRTLPEVDTLAVTWQNGRPPGHTRVWFPLPARPPEVTVLAGMTSFATLACVALLVIPASSSSPRPVMAVYAVLSATISLGLWLAPRVPEFVLHAMIGMWIAGITSALVEAATPQAAAGTALTYTWTLFYTTYFFRQAHARIYAIASCLACLTGLLLHPFPGAAAVWLTITVTNLWGCELISRLLSRLRDAATRDALTGQLNRTALVARGPEELIACRRRGRPLCVSVLDLDHFKQVNDRYGHAAGDELLSELAREWREKLRATDVLFRSGGDEFVLLLPDTGLEEATALLTRLRESSAAPWCFGVAPVEQDDDLDRALARADAALYAAKAERLIPRPRPQSARRAARLA